MQIDGKHIVITGAAGGIGSALARSLAALGGRMVVSDMDQANAEQLAAAIGGLGVVCDVSRESDIQELIKQAEAANGPVDIFVSNAGFAAGEANHAASASNEVWQKNWDVHVMAHVWASRALLPGMIERGDGYLINVASAAGLLSQISDAAYTATKHAAVAFAESLAISHMDDGIKVSVICPQYVATNILGLMTDAEKAAEIPGVISAQQCADVIVQGIQDETFLILPHPEVAEFTQRRGSDVKRWLDGMRRYRASLLGDDGKIDLAKIFKH
ncbi:MAG: SDR family oxidoreductase [Gammaproteobacteria bacterium]|nr:SDR family oxidoreductase [Gammaproteobacteria bacterium]